jgi:hypothetical protein
VGIETLEAIKLSCQAGSDADKRCLVPATH